MPQPTPCEGPIIATPAPRLTRLPSAVRRRGANLWRRGAREGELATPPALVPATDLLRVAAAVGLVAYHAAGEPAKHLGATCLAIFVLLSYQQMARPMTLGVFLSRRSLRMVTPWLGWWLVYAAARVVSERGFAGLLDQRNPWQVMDWPSAHLWYLPFLLFTTLGLLALRPLVRRIPLGWRWAVGSAVGMTTMSLGPQARTLLPGEPILIYALPLVGFGLAYSYALRYRGPGRLRRFLAVSALLATSALLSWAAGLADEVAVGYLLGSVLILACALPVPRRPAMSRLAVLTFGVYLAHPLCFRVVDKLGALTGFGSSLPAQFLAGTVGAALLTLWMRRTPVLRALV